MKEIETNKKKRDACVNIVILHVELHHSQIYCAFDFHNRIDGLFSELVSHFSLKVKIANSIPIRLCKTHIWLE